MYLYIILVLLCIYKKLTGATVSLLVLSLALFCTPPPLCVLTKEEANGTETVSRVLMVEVNAIFVCGDHATVLLLQGLPVSYI